MRNQLLHEGLYLFGINAAHTFESLVADWLFFALQYFQFLRLALFNTTEKIA